MRRNLIVSNIVEMAIEVLVVLVVLVTVVLEDVTAEAFQLVKVLY